MRKMSLIGNSTQGAAYSIDLYAINLKKRHVPEESIQYHVRRFTPEGLVSNAFGCCSWAESTNKVSSYQMKQFQISDLVTGHPTVVI